MPLTEDLVRWAANLCLAAAGLGCVYLLIGWVLVLRFGSKASAAELWPVPVTILVPLCGPEPGLHERLSRLCQQDYPAPFQIVCGTQDARDPANAVVKQIADRFPHRQIDLHIDPRINGGNMKISNLINMVARARHDILVQIDSDMEVCPDYLAKVIGALQKPGVGAVTCLYYGMAKGGTWARLSAMGINLHLLPNVIFALGFDLARPCFGATIAISRDTLRRIGGFRSFVDQLWDDYALGEAVRELGLRVTVPPFALGHVCTDRSASEFFAAQLRYARTIRSIDPAGYAGGIITNPFPLALAALAFGGGKDALALAAVALACRAVLSRCIEYRFDTQAQAYLLLPLRDLFSSVVYVAGFCGSTVAWRGHRYRIAHDGTVIPNPR
ncbi:bacteriohopanetetrol glucosamine biosynthesis glycosyltransferase HpnI [Mesorhizobium sp. BAC0120]|uniref:bacteriohopanetetrol glucosamine biosynthesis glycosyltransferase HpnI n=1 Tax=Mesorhizobium sp. BAC0120 TaxID=3090670 RepID=UPI00298D3A5D|nr:bacteriohopanetetrol glucosamine biosynthesis glycosyltransferase HpnI [Mesorhizobium sp. BAC0120]MDW6024664.1 bacteriohopanetetrol glucosamine biosynthesis glycosyltransferase HpnI [Mesorhizobium sp. BAC0120]